MKRGVRILLLACIFVCFSNRVYAKVIVATECEYTEQYEKWLLLSDEEKSKVIKPVKCKNEGLFYFKPVYAGAVGAISQTSFDLRQGGYDTGTKTQENMSLCWAFADINSVESNLLVNNIKNGSEKYVFSAAHMELMLQDSLFTTPIPVDRDFDVGGNFDLSSAYFFNRMGPVLESDVPFSLAFDTKNGGRTATLSDLGDYRAVVSVNDTVEFYTDLGPCTQTSITSIKNYLVTNGGISALTFFDDDNYSDVGNRQYYFSTVIDGNDMYNHQVSIIGWDDSIEASNFRSSTGTVPSRNGAWIVKNSNNYSLIISGRGNGYEYISYDDPFICSNVGGFYNVSTDLDDNVYVYDEVGVNMVYGVDSSNMVYLANKFSKKSGVTEQLNKVTFYSYTINQPFEILYSSDGQLGNLTSLYTGTTNKIGYTTVDVSNKNIRLTNQNFAVSIKYTRGSADILLPVFIEMDSAWFGNLKVTTGRSFYSMDGDNWNNLIMGEDKAYASIKVYTDDVADSSQVFNVTFSVTDGVSAIGTSSSSCNASGNSCTVVLPSITPNNGYRVLGWFLNLNDDVAIGQPGDSYNLSSNTTLYAKVERNTTTYTVSLHFDSGAIQPQNTSLSCTTSAQASSCQVTLPEINVKENYEALGWFNASTGGNRVDEGGYTISISNNIDLYARTVMQARTFVATFNTSDGVTAIGTSSSSCTTQNGSNKCNITLPTITASGDYTILGWYNDEELIGQPGDTYQLGSNLTLTAKTMLQPTEYTAIFRTTEGVSSVATSSSSCTLSGGNSKCSITLPMINVSSGYNALGWYDASSGGTKVGDANDTYQLSGNVTLYALAEKTSTISNETVFTITLKKSDSNAVIDKTSLTCSTTGSSCVVTLPAITTSNDYEVLGWYNNSTGGVKVGDVLSQYVVTEDKTLYARVMKKPVDSDPNVTDDDKIVVIKNPSNSDYTSGNINNNPGTGSMSTFMVLMIVLSFGGILYYNYHLKTLKNN